MSEILIQVGSSSIGFLLDFEGEVEDLRRTKVSSSQSRWHSG
jgi:hypothetical protein